MPQHYFAARRSYRSPRPSGGLRLLGETPSSPSVQLGSACGQALSWTQCPCGIEHLCTDEFPPSAQSIHRRQTNEPTADNRRGEDHSWDNLWCTSRSSATIRRSSAATTATCSGGSSTRPRRWRKRCRNRTATDSWTSSPPRMGQASGVVSEADQATRATLSSTLASRMSRLRCSEPRVSEAHGCWVQPHHRVVLSSVT